jgi:hypothetical protein
MNYRDDTEMACSHSPIYGHLPFSRSAYSGRAPRTREECGFGYDTDPVAPMPEPGLLERFVVWFTGMPK